jgi:CheY-like chemotaxis protein
VSRYLLKTVLGQAEFRFLEAAGGNEGLRRASEGKPDLVILDLAMPDLSGFEVLHRLKENPRTADIPVIIHTSKVLNSQERSLLSSAVAVVPKESRSRELSLAHFADAFSRAGFSLNVPEKEAGHV